MKSKRELRDLEKQKEKSSAKVSQFLLNLQTLKKQMEQERQSSMSNIRSTPVINRSPIKKRTCKRINENEVLMTAPSSVDRLSPMTKEFGCLGRGNPGLVDETGRPLVSIREAATIVADFRGSLTKTVVQRGLLSDNMYKLKDQQKEIEQMETIKRQLEMGRAITNLDLYKSLIFKERKKAQMTNGISVPANGRITKKDVVAMTFSRNTESNRDNVINQDISNLRGQAPVQTKKKELRNIIVPQEEIKKANKEFWRHNDNCGFDSDTSDPEIKQLFKSELFDDSPRRSEKDDCDRKKPVTPQFLIEMRKRQLERAEKREEIRKIHELKEAEKKRQAHEAEILRLQREDEEKLNKKRKLKAMLKAEKQHKEKMQMQIERLTFLGRRAKLHNETRLKKRFGFEPWKQLMQEKKINEFWAEKHHEKSLLSRCLQDWIHWTKSNQIMRRVKAEEFDKQKLLTTSFGRWLEVQFSVRQFLHEM